jgi:hypothetical protein
MRYILAAIAMMFTACEAADECVTCRYQTGETQEICASDLGVYAHQQLTVFQDEMERNGWVCNRH